MKNQSRLAEIEVNGQEQMVLMCCLHIMRKRLAGQRDAGEKCQKKMREGQRSANME
jgi:hypothetical protein